MYSKTSKLTFKA